MILKFVIATSIILGLLAGWIAVQHLARRYAARHPEFGPAREEGSGCGALFCLCRDRVNCPRKTLMKSKQSGHEK